VLSVHCQALDDGVLACWTWWKWLCVSRVLTAEEASDDDGHEHALDQETERRLDAREDDIQAVHHHVAGADTAVVECEKD